MNNLQEVLPIQLSFFNLFSEKKIVSVSRALILDMRYSGLQKQVLTLYRSLIRHGKSMKDKEEGKQFNIFVREEFKIQVRGMLICIKYV